MFSLNQKASQIGRPYTISYAFFQRLFSATAVKRTSVEELRAVSQESWMTPTIKPTPTTCMAKSFEIPKRLPATGTNRRDPPAIPEAPQAEIAETTLRMSAVAKST